MSDIEIFQTERKEIINQQNELSAIYLAKKQFIETSSKVKYSYLFDWLGLPIIQYPQDIVAMQEIIWQTRPDIIIETGVARGGSLILSASILHLLNGKGKVIGIDIDIRSHNREAIENHPLAFRIHLLQGSSTAEEIVAEVKKLIPLNSRVMVILDSSHTHAHVLTELERYSPFVTQGCYLVVMDTMVEDLPNNYIPGRPWGKGNNPKTAVHAFLKKTNRFEIDETIPNKLLITAAPDGYLKCIY